MHHTSEHTVASAGADNVVRLWDHRFAKRPFHELSGHEEEVTRLQWAPWSEEILVSAAAAPEIIVWDLSRIGAEQDVMFLFSIEFSST